MQNNYKHNNHSNNHKETTTVGRQKKKNKETQNNNCMETKNKKNIQMQYKERMICQVSVQGLIVNGSKLFVAPNSGYVWILVQHLKFYV